MEAKLRKSLIPVLVALMLMMLCCEGLPRAQQTLAEDILLGQRDGYALYALADAPQGEERFFDSDTLYQGELLYVSPGHPLDSQRTHQQARNVRHMVGLYIPAAETVTLSEATIYALCELAEDNPLLSTWITEGMRSPEAQRLLQSQTFESYRATMPLAQAMSRAIADVPDGGCSEHQLAACFDVRLGGEMDWSQSDPLLRTEDGRWLAENAWHYGVIRRYPPDQPEAAGWDSERLHFRYVGKAHAAAMHAAGYCLAKYLQALHRYGALRLDGPQGKPCYILCAQMMKNGAAFVVPDGYEAAPSADNLGYAVCVLTGNQDSAG